MPAARARAQSKDLERLLRAVEAVHPGSVTGGGRSHYKVRVPGHDRLVVVSSSPHKGGRAIKNARAQLRRAPGLEGL